MTFTELYNLLAGNSVLPRGVVTATAVPSSFQTNSSPAQQQKSTTTTTTTTNVVDTTVVDTNSALSLLVNSLPRSKSVSLNVYLLTSRQARCSDYM